MGYDFVDLNKMVETAYLLALYVLLTLAKHIGNNTKDHFGDITEMVRII